MIHTDHSTPRQLTLRYLFALGLLGILAVVNYRMFQAEIREGEASSDVQRVSGRHRLLIQQCVIVAEELVRTMDAGERRTLRNKLLQLATELESVHYRLMQFDAPPIPDDEPPDDNTAANVRSKVHQIYFKVPWLLDTEVRNYIAQIQSLADSEPEDLSPANPHLSYIRSVALADGVNRGLDAVVSAYQEQSEAKTTRLRQVAASSFVGTCLVLFLTGLFVFRPMARRVRQEMHAMDDLNQTLEQRVEERTTLAEQRARELEESESALRKQTRILWSILDSMGDGVIVADESSDFQLMNRAARRLLNVGPGAQPDLRVENWAEAFGIRIYRPDQETSYPQEELPLSLAIRGQSVTRAELFLRRTTEPGEMWVSVTARPVVDDAGGVYGGVTVWRDITDRKESERELRDSEALYQSLVENLPMCVLRKDSTGRFVFANRRFCDLIDKELEEVLGRTEFDLFPVSFAEKCQEEDRQVMTEGTSLEAVAEYEFASRPPMPVEVRKSVVRDSAGQTVGLQSIFWDISARVRAEREREEMQQKILQSERLAAIGQTVAGVAHESRNALQKIEACTQLLRWRLDGMADREVDELINDVQRAQLRLLRLFEDLRGFAAPLRLDRRTCDLSKVIQRAWETARNGNNGAASCLEIKSAEDHQISADPFQLEQVFRNLFENSLAACHGQAHVDVEFGKLSEKDRDWLEICISDNGPGIPAEARSKVFEPFFSTKSEGTGLGATIVKRIVTAHGGRVELVDRETPGTAFRMVLPEEEQ